MSDNIYPVVNITVSEKIVTILKKSIVILQMNVILVP